MAVYRQPLPFLGRASRDGQRLRDLRQDGQNLRPLAERGRTRQGHRVLRKYSDRRHARGLRRANRRTAAGDRDRPCGDRVLVWRHSTSRGRKEHATLREPGVAGVAERQRLRRNAGAGSARYSGLRPVRAGIEASPSVSPWGCGRRSQPMPNYRAPLQDMQFVITELAGLERLAALPGYEEVTPDLVEAVLEEAAKLAGDVLAPLNRPGDEQGAALTKDGVVAADGFAAAYTRFVENGWNGLSGDPEYGGERRAGVVAPPA